MFLMPQFQILTLGQFSVSLINIQDLGCFSSEGRDKIWKNFMSCNVFFTKSLKMFIIFAFQSWYLDIIDNLSLTSINFKCEVILFEFLRFYAINGKRVLLHSSTYHYQTIIVYWIIAHYCPPNSLIYFTKKWKRT